MSQSFTAISSRFLTEQDYICRYIDFLESVTTVTEDQIGDVLRTLSRHGVAEIARDSSNRQWRQPCTVEDLTQVVNELSTVSPKLDAAIESAKLAADAAPRPDRLSDVDVRSVLGEWIEYARDTLSDTSSESIELLRSQIAEQNQRLVSEYGDEAETIGDEDTQLVIDGARYVVAHGHLAEMVGARNRLRELELVCRAGRSDTELAIHRQGFILLMTAFDAAVFDLTREALKSDFWQILPALSQKRKIALEDLSEFSSFDQFRDSVVEEQLRFLYLRDLLIALEGLGVPLTNQDGEDHFGHLVEMVMRRNIHVHNRGIVDERYLDRTRDGTARYNIYALQPGEPAPVDGDYWRRANRLATYAVQAIAEWACSRSCDE